MRYSLCCLLLIFSSKLSPQNIKNIKLTNVGKGWASNSVNTTIFRKNSLVTYKNLQFIAFYDSAGCVVLAKRKSGSRKWEIKRSVYRGNAADAHNGISIIVDGDGYLHLAWDQHNNTLNYCKGKKPLSLDFTEKMTMTNLNEAKVSYPEFYKMPGGDLLFLYRDGGSGNGNLVVNRYYVKTKVWKRVQNNLIDGEGRRNAYWQACVDIKGTIYISWVWRESPDVASNHDICYARSNDGGKTWQNSNGIIYQLPINIANAEYACIIPQKSELINQTSIYADDSGHPFIATYWKEKRDSVPQYHLLYVKDKKWQAKNLGFRRSGFSLSGTGTKRIPISRPQVITWSARKLNFVGIIFRDEDRQEKISVAINKDLKSDDWYVSDIYNLRVGSWEPSYDTELWQHKRLLNLFVQKTDQADAEARSQLEPQMVKVLEWKPGFKKSN